MNFWTVNKMLAESFWLNCQIFIVTLLLALPLGLLLSFGSMSRCRPLSLLSRLYIYLMRSTPLMLQLAIVYYLPGFLNPGHMLSRMTAACLAFVLNYAAYFSEIFRGGIQGVPKGQQEAGQVLGMTKGQIFYKITLLQVIKRIVPPIGNEIITLVKDTSLARIIAITELIKAGEAYIKAEGIIWPLFYTGVFYLVFVGILTLLFNFIERKLSYFR